MYGPSSNADHADLVLKADSVYEKFTVDELENLEYRLTRIFHVSPQSVLRLCQVEEGCIQLLFQVPSFVQQEIFPLSREQEKSLAAMGIIKLTCEMRTTISRKNLHCVLIVTGSLMCFPFFFYRKMSHHKQKMVRTFYRLYYMQG